MDLETWLRKNNMETNELARLAGCSRQVIWKIKKNETVDEDTAQKIHFITGGQVKPLAKAKGRPRKKKPNLPIQTHSTQENTIHMKGTIPALC